MHFFIIIYVIRLFCHKAYPFHAFDDQKQASSMISGLPKRASFAAGFFFRQTNV